MFVYVFTCIFVILYMYTCVCVRCYLGLHSVYRCHMMCVQHLWVMVVQEADLKGELRVMKDFWFKPLNMYVHTRVYVFTCVFVILYLYICMCEILPGLAFCIQVSYDVYVFVQHLWVMVVQEADLKGELRVMKDFFLLGRGELYLAFIDQAQHLLQGPPAPSTEHGLYRTVAVHTGWTNVPEIGCDCR